MTRLASTEHERLKHWDEGFTLVEMMFASVYLAIGLLAVAAMVDTALSRNVDAKRLTVATNLATEMIERVRFNSPANATSIVGVGYPYDQIQACNYACTGNGNQAFNFMNTRGLNYRIVVTSTGKASWCYTSSCAP